MEILHLLCVVTTVPLLFFDKLCALEEVVLHPVLSTVKDEWIDHHHKEQLEIGMPFKYT